MSLDFRRDEIVTGHNPRLTASYFSDSNITLVPEAMAKYLRKGRVRRPMESVRVNAQRPLRIVGDPRDSSRTT